MPDKDNIGPVNQIKRAGTQYLYLDAMGDEEFYDESAQIQEIIREETSRFSAIPSRLPGEPE